MTIYRWLIVALWLGLIPYWVVSSIDAKRSLGPRQTWHGIGLRLIVVALALAILAIPPVRQTFRDLQAYQARSVVLGVAGVVLCVAGVGLAALGRFYLGRNWGMPGSRKENPELITGGPYQYVRHPIYGGVMLAMLGTAIGASAFWVVPLVLFSGYFVYSARREEKIMIAQFPEQYPAYMRRTRMLLPFAF
ncbi:MAG: isoprenylcysteine carboxylmethyltransferase family protein [Xanthobacteraceae bacterium]